MTVKTWIANEIVLESSKIYANALEEVDVFATFTCGNKTLTIPAFWDGGKTWKVRFALPKVGIWSYTTDSTDAENLGLKTSGEIECVAYDGDKAIYKHGFVKTVPNKRYFVYDDGTPFFYLGDTHWSFNMEEWDEPGDHADETKCTSHFKYLVDKRVEQGFTVYQSEPNGLKLEDGISEEDLEAFKNFDLRFKYIADAGLVHANAQINFTRWIAQMKRVGDAQYMKRLARYWVARFGAYPVMWTLAQECDADYYFNRSGYGHCFQKEDNPLKVVAEGIFESDPYAHPLTAHMCYSTMNANAPDWEGVVPSTSAFREVKGHSWYSYQWPIGMDNPIDYEIPRDGLINGQGKPCVVYESRYDGLETKNFGARGMGWIAYLNGMYGYGYGAVDIWFYKSGYYGDRTSFDGHDHITPEEKLKHWSESVEFKTPYQLNYMRQFFEKLSWWKLMPRFDSPFWFIPENKSYPYSIASDERKLFVAYFNNVGFETGTFPALDRAIYSYQWFDPRHNLYTEKSFFEPDVNRMWRAPFKPTPDDWVLLVKKEKPSKAKIDTTIFERE
ncbi:MAG: DUF4038 domain-containing protein [Clostridia bacterium]|nr:DUF4038 domain-containing protein [Clostridia bacterium]